MYRSQRYILPSEIGTTSRPEARGFYALPPRAKNDFCCAHITFEQPGQRRPICTDVGGAPASFSFKRCATITASARINTGEPFSDSARCTSIPSCPRMVFSSITAIGTGQEGEDARTSHASFPYSRSSSYSVSMWSLVNAIGTTTTRFLPRRARPLSASLVCGPIQALGPTWDCHARG